MPKTIIIPAMDDLWDAEHEMFVTTKEQTLVIEHSLISISKWEQKWKKPFISDEEKTYEEFIDYIRCMTLNKVNDSVYSLLTVESIKEIEDYISDPMTATTFSDLMNQRGRREVITAEILYYEMITFGIPVDICEKWHLNRLIALIRVFAIKGGNEKKMSRSEAAMFQRSINEARRSKGRRH